MTDILCGYTDRDETIVAYLYNDIDPAERRVFQQHLLTCTTCRDEIAAFKTVQKQLARWDPPLPASISNRELNPQSANRNPQSSPWWREIPAWVQVAAALLFLGVSAGVANLDVHYDASGLSLRTGWSTPAAVAAAPSNDTAPWRADLARLEQQLKSEVRAAMPASAAAMPQAPTIRNVSSGTAAIDADTLKRVRALLDESEKRQQRELALRVAEVLRDVNAQRQADLVKIDRNLGQMENTLGVQVLQQRQQVNYLMRANQRQ